MKSLVASALAQRVIDGETIGIGSGSTVEAAVEKIGERIEKEGIRIIGVPTSIRTAFIAEKAGILVLSPLSRVVPVWAFDGADEVDPAFNMIKGRGAAMLSEKILARRAKKLVIIVSEDKLVNALGQRFAIPVEVVPEALDIVEAGLRKLGAKEVVLRQADSKYGPVVTEHNNLVFDVCFDRIEPELEEKINALTGVVENGLFVGCTRELLVARKDGVWSRTLGNGGVREEQVKF